MGRLDGGDSGDGNESGDGLDGFAAWGVQFGEAGGFLSGQGVSGLEGRSLMGF